MTSPNTIRGDVTTTAAEIAAMPPNFCTADLSVGGSLTALAGAIVAIVLMSIASLKSKSYLKITNIGITASCSLARMPRVGGWIHGVPPHVQDSIYATSLKAIVRV